MRHKVTVVGAGVIGLSCAVRLAEAGFPVDVLTADRLEDTTSAVAGGLWLPYRAEPADRVARWAATSFAEFVALHRRGRRSVLLREGTLLHRHRPQRPFWADLVEEVSGLRELTNPAPGYRYGYALRVPVIDTPRYLGELAAQLVDLGGRIRQERVEKLPAERMVVDAAGFGARELVPDPSLYAVRGQVVVVDNPGLSDWLCDEDEQDGALTYVVPRRTDVIVGGTAQERDERAQPDPDEAAAILDRARALVPELAAAPVRDHRVGFRPARPAVRLDLERSDRGVVVHCYGHGGSGVTLSWGCAEDVVRLALAQDQDGPTSLSARSDGR